jgi:FRG domain
MNAHMPTPKTFSTLVQQLTRRSFDTTKRAAIPFVAFRGVGRIYGNLNTGIQRQTIGKRTLRTSELSQRERLLIDTFRSYASAHQTIGESDWDVLIVGQHYRLPTRLLDWTSNPYVALYFATENDGDLRRDGEVWCAHRQESNKLLPDSLRSLMQTQAGYQLFHARTMVSAFPTLSEFDKQDDSLLWVEPPSIDHRVINQYAFFSVMPRVESSTSDWLSKHPTTYWRVKVPANLKHEVRARLDRMNITRRTIYPGLESVAIWLRDSYAGRVARYFKP